MKQLHFTSQQHDRLFALLLSFFLMTFGSMTSPLFPLHTWVDQNCFLSVARMWTQGRIPYRDIFEQKGPLLYALHLPAAAMPSLRFFGVYIVQIALWYAIFMVIYRISDLTLPPKYRRTTAALSGLVMVCTFCYSRGDNAEEFCLLPVMCSLLMLLRSVKQNENTFVMSWKTFFVNGMLAGTVLWIKFSMLGFYIGWCLFAGLLLWHDQNIFAALFAGVSFLCGMLAVSLPWLIYFAANHALCDLVQVYFISNATLYPRKTSILRMICEFFTKDILWNPALMLPILAAVIMHCMKSIKMREKLAVLVPLCTLYVFVFIGGVRYRYYLLILAAFFPWAVTQLLSYADKLLRKIHICIKSVAWLLILLLCGNCAAYLGKSWDSYPQSQFAKQIPADATLLNYGFLDGGFALMSGADFPQGRFFCKVNIAREMLPEMYEAQEETIRQREADYVVVRWTPSEEALTDRYRFSPFFENYTQIATAQDAHDGYSYALYQLK